MKKLLLSTLLVAAMMPMSMSAQKEGKAILKNVASGLYWGAANNWGTHASLMPASEFQTLHLQPDGTYTMETQVSNNRKNYYFGGDYMDGAATKLTITKSDDHYTVANANGEFFGNSTDLEADGDHSLRIPGTYILGKNKSGDDALWDIIFEDEWNDYLASASENNPIEATFLVKNPNFGRNNRNVNQGNDPLGAAWTMQSSNQNLSGGHDGNRCAESWRAAFTLSQDIELPNGVYVLRAQAALTDYTNAYDGRDYPVVYANDETRPFKEMVASDRGTSMAQLSRAFSVGQYETIPVVVAVTEGKLTIGVKGTRTDTWCIWDNFRLSYYGATADVETVKKSVLAESLQELIDKAKALLPTAEGSIGNQLSNAISQGELASTSSEMESAIANLEEVIRLSSYYVTIKDRLAKMKELIDATNVYTEEAYNTYYAEPYDKYYNSVLTKDEVIELMNSLQDPLAVAGWHDRGLKVDNFLLSAWDTDPDYPDNNPYYINTWSTEGVEGSSNYMGAEFGVPFFEYWVPDGSKLSERSLTATLEKYLDGDQFVELKDGEYKVRARVRVLMNAGADHPYGITLTANDGEPVDVCAGAQVGSSLFYMDTFEAIGKVEDGKLTIKFNIAADNNVSWLSFKDVMIEAPAPDVAITSLSVTPQPVLINDETKSFDVNLTVQNLGNEAAQNVVIKLSDGKGWSVTYPSTSEAPTGEASSGALTLEAGEELAITFTYDQELTPGSVSLRAEISADGEKNIDNNSSSTSVRLLMDGSDMTITNVEAPKSLLITEGEQSVTGTIKVTVKNLGTQTAEGVSVVLNVNGEKYAASAPITVEAGKEEVVEIEFSSSKSGEYTLTAEVISDADVDEENNLWADEIVIKVKNQGELTAGLDLSIENIDVPEMSDGAIRVNDEEGGYTVNVSVYNNGTEDAENVVVKLFINGEEFATNADVEGFETLNLASAEMVEIPFFVENPEFTDVEIYAEVIAEGDVDESNNVSETITAGVKYEGIDVALLDVIYPEAISVDSEDDAIVTVMVKNISEDSRVTDDRLLKAENVVVHLFINGVEVATSKPFSLYKGADAHAYLAIDRNYLTSEKVILTARVTADKDGNESNDWSEELPIQVSGVVTGIDSILARFGQNAQVYTLDGKKVDLSSGMLKKGLYIINGKKTAIK